MNAELRRLLVEAGYALAGSRDAEGRILVINNQGSIPPSRDVPRDFAQKGFKLLLLGENGKPTHFARCGATDDHALAREGEILERLCRVPSLERTVPHTRTARSSMLQVQLNAYIAGRLYQQSFGRRSPRRWQEEVAEIMEVRWHVSTQAAATMPKLLVGGPLVRLVDEAGPQLAKLRESGVASRDIVAVEQALADGGELPRVLQHGDLWPGNVIRAGGSWWLIDFAEFAQVQVPMYDLFHMLQYNPGRTRADTRHAWFTFGEGAIQDQWTAASRAIVHGHAKKRGYQPSQVGAALVHYLVHISAYRLREGVLRQYGEMYVKELSRVAGELRRGASLGSLVGY